MMQDPAFREKTHKSRRKPAFVFLSMIDAKAKTGFQLALE